MAGKAAGQEDVAGELKSTIATLRRRALNFAIGMDGKTPIICTHIKKKPKTLRREAKSQGSGPKICSGEMSMNGKTIMLACVEEDAPDIIAKLTTKFLRSQGLNFKVEIMPGAVEEADEEEEEEEVQAAAGARRPASQGAEEDAPEARAASGAEGDSAVEEAEEELEAAGIDTGGAPSSATGREDTAAGQTDQAAPAARTADQEQMLAGLRDMKSLLTQVKNRGRPEDLQRMSKFGELFKKAVKQNDARVGRKTLDAMRTFASQVEVNAQATEKRRKSRVDKLQNIRGRLEGLLRSVG